MNLITYTKKIENELFELTGNNYEVNIKIKDIFNNSKSKEDFIKKFTSEYSIKKGRINRDNEFNKHIFRYILKKKFQIKDKELAILTNSDRTNKYNSIKKIQGFIDIKDEKTIDILKKWM